MYQLYQNSANSPPTEAMDYMSRAFEDAFQSLGLSEHTNHPLIDIVVSKIIARATAGERDPIRLCESVIKEIRALASMGIGTRGG